MPSRVIRGEINASDSLSRVSMEADLTFRALLVVVDDFGRFDARPDVLKASLFPLRPKVTPARVKRWVDELSDEGCVETYEVEGRPYLELTGWEKHRSAGRRAQRSRFPDPPRKSEEILGDLGDPPSYRVARSEKREARSGLDASPEAGSAPSRPNGRCASSDLQALWTRGLEEAERQSGRPAGWTLTDARRAQLRALARDHPGDPEAFAKVVRGYWTSRASFENRERYFSPDTLLRAGKRESYFEAAANGAAVRVVTWEV